MGIMIDGPLGRMLQQEETAPEDGGSQLMEGEPEVSESESDGEYQEPDEFSESLSEDVDFGKDLEQIESLDFGVDKTVKSEEIEDIPSDDDIDSSDDAGAEDTESVGMETSGEETGPNFDTGLLDRASQYGMNYSDVSKFSSNEALEAAVSNSEKLWQQAQAQQQAQHDAWQRYHDGQVQAEQPESIAETQVPDWEKMKEDGWDEDIVSAMKSQSDSNQMLQREVADLKSNQHAVAQQQEQVRQQESVRYEIEREGRFDKWVEDLGNEFLEVFGEGESKSLNKLSSEFNNRSNVYRMMMDLQQIHQARGESPSEENLRQMALNAVFGHINKQIARKGLKAQIKKAGKHATSRPGRSKAKAKSGDAAAVDFVKQWEAKHPEIDENDFEYGG